MRQHHRPVDTSVGVSGRHDFAVRETRSRQSRASRPSHPAPNVRDDRETPLLIGRGTGGKMPLICPTTQAKGLRHFNATGKSHGSRRILSSDEQLLVLSSSSQTGCWIWSDERKANPSQNAAALNEEKARPKPG